MGDWAEQQGVPLLEHRLGRARVAFSGRRGGVSEGAYCSLNVGLLTGDDRDSVYQNRSRLAAALGLSRDQIASAHQVHEARLIEHSSPQLPSPFADGEVAQPEGDGHATAVPGLGLLVYVADCLPIALEGPGGVAMLHGGWRPLAAGIVGSGAGAVSAERALIGPGIGRCCFEVGPEVLAAFAPLGPGLADGRMLDLTEVARRLLSREGVGEIESVDLCTRCNPELLFSHRGQGPETGRQAGIAWIPGGGEA